jgi:hypothetical protein
MRAIDSPQKNRNFELYFDRLTTHHGDSPRSTLPLLVPLIGTDHTYNAVPPNDLALAADALHGCQHFHHSLLIFRTQAQPALRRFVA